MVPIEAGFQAELKCVGGWVSFISAKGAVLIHPELEVKPLREATNGLEAMARKASGRQSDAWHALAKPRLHSPTHPKSPSQ